MDYSLTRTAKQIPHHPNVGLVFKLGVMVTWLLLFLFAYPLLTYTSTNSSMWQRYSSQYGIGLLIYLGLLLLWPLLLGLPRRYIIRISASLESLKLNHWLHVQYLITWIFLTLLALTFVRLWGWGYNRYLWLDIALLGGWLSLFPMYWVWGLQGWPIKWVPLGWVYDWLVQYPQFWLPPLIGAGVLLASNVLGFNAARRQLMLALGLVPGVAALLIFLRWPPAGLIALIAVALLVPTPPLPGGLNAAVLFLILLIGLQVLAVIAQRRPMRLVRSRTIWPSLVLMLVATLAFGIGQLPWFPVTQRAPLEAQLGGLSMFILAPGIFLLVAHQVRNLRWLEWLTWTFLALAALQIGSWLLPPLKSLTSYFYPDGTVNNAMFWLWLVALALSQAIYNQKLHLGWRLALGGLAATTLYVAIVLNYDWKSGYLPPLVCIAVLIGLRSWRTALVMALLALPLGMYVASQAIASDEYSYYSRLDAWLVILQMVRFNPITGFGPANYWWYAILFPLRGYASRFNSHNQYLDVVAQTGFLGLACFLWFFAEVGWLGWQLRNRVPAGFARAYVYGALGGLAGMLASGMLVDWVLPFTYNIGLTGFRTSMLAWLFLGGVVSIEQIYRRQVLGLDLIPPGHSRRVPLPQNKGLY